MSETNAAAYQSNGVTIPKSRYDCVEQYVVSDPNHVKNGSYCLWAGCRWTPVVYDNQEASGMYHDAVRLPSFWVQPFLVALKESAPEVRKDPRQRLISVIQLNGTHKLYIFPDLTGNHRYLIASDAPTRDWLYYINPETNHAIVEQMKIR